MSIPDRPTVLAALLLTSACLPRQTGDQHEVAPDSTHTEAARAPRCSSASERAIALLEPNAAGLEPYPCGCVIETDARGQLLVLRRGRNGEPEQSAPLARGPAPEACGEALELCELSGIADALGPIVLASVRGPESEVPTQIYLGVVEGERLAFVETWYGLHSVVDHTRVGPPWALGPFDCDGELLLLPAARLPEAEHEPTTTLREFAGRWRIDDAGFAQPPAAAASLDPASCRALIPRLP